MTVTALPETPTNADLASRAQDALKSATPFLILLALTCAVRLPFFMQADDDEFFFALMAQRWLEGNLPYATGFDVKPPGIFFIFAVFQSLFGASLATIKGMEILFVALGAFGLYRIMDRHASQAAALWAGGLYPVYTLVFSGTNAAAMIIQLPFLIFAFYWALSAVASPTSARSLLLLSGIAIGFAGMIKHTALFEAVILVILIGVFAPRKNRWNYIFPYIFGAVLPALVFGVYFWLSGHFAPLFEAVMVLARLRTDASVLSGYDPRFAHVLTVQGALINGLLLSSPVLFLWGCSLFTTIRWRKIVQQVRSRLIISAIFWLFAAMAGVAYGRVLTTYYLLTIVPPLLILTSLFLAHGIRLNRLHIAFVATIALTTPMLIGRAEIFERDPGIKYDYPASQQVATKLSAHGLQSGGELFVFNRSYGIYLLSGGRPLTPYFHATHYLSRFITPSEDPLGDNIRAKPRFIVVANPNERSGYDIGSQYDRMFAVLKSDYRLVDQVTGTKDSFYIYERH